MTDLQEIIDNVRENVREDAIERKISESALNLMKNFKERFYGDFSSFDDLLDQATDNMFIGVKADFAKNISSKDVEDLMAEYQFNEIKDAVKEYAKELLTGAMLQKVMFDLDQHFLERISITEDGKIEIYKKELTSFEDKKNNEILEAIYMKLADEKVFRNKTPEEINKIDEVVRENMEESIEQLLNRMSVVIDGKIDRSSKFNKNGMEGFVVFEENGALFENIDELQYALKQIVLNKVSEHKEEIANNILIDVRQQFEMKNAISGILNEQNAKEKTKENDNGYKP